LGTALARGPGIDHIHESRVSKIKGISMSMTIEQPLARKDAKEVLVQAEPSHDQVARRAEALYREGGRKDGNAMEDWLAAERELRTKPVA
jgi:hypothetical protein